MALAGNRGAEGLPAPISAYCGFWESNFVQKNMFLVVLSPRVPNGTAVSLEISWKQVSKHKIASIHQPQMDTTVKCSGLREAFIVPKATVTYKVVPWVACLGVALTSSWKVVRNFS